MDTPWIPSSSRMSDNQRSPASRLRIARWAFLHQARKRDHSPSPRLAALTATVRTMTPPRSPDGIASRCASNQDRLLPELDGIHPEGGAPAEALAGVARKQYQNACRREDPLGRGQPATWRLLLIKVAATVMVSCRRIVVRLSGTWPNRAFFEHISQHVSSRPAGAGCWTGERTE